MNEELLEELEDLGAEVEDTLDRLMGDGEMYLEYLMQFPDNENIKKLRNAVDQRDADTAMKEVHTLKGVGLNLGFLPFVDAAMSMLLDFREGKEEEAFAQMDEVQEAFDKIGRAHV